MLKGKKTQRLNEYILQNREMESKKRFFLQERKRLNYGARKFDYSTERTERGAKGY
ncbi:hypothetical protein DMNBHIDG_00118 [Candidatus Methanoperedenaceae archaeon GB37]|nr:hypothetical protein DMNBHIDG_00118 [Candidatus Methanoperedenaceae archaeon GB37]